jgi:hypothetical protein
VSFGGGGLSPWNLNLYKVVWSAGLGVPGAIFFLVKEIDGWPVVNVYKMLSGCSQVAVLLLEFSLVMWCVKAQTRQI